MIPIPTRSGQDIAVLGLGASGVATAEALAAGGARVAAWDDDGDTRRRAEAAGATLVDLDATEWPEFDALVLSPGIPLTHPAPHPLVARARTAGIPVIGDVELLCEACPEARRVGITGTNGKSTTTALIGHLLAGSAQPVQVGGNLGPAALSLEPLGGDGVYVLELSSYQLDLTHEAAFDFAVLLNVSPDHLDRHGGMEGYIAAKKRIFRDGEGRRQTAIIGVDDKTGAAIADEIEARGWRVTRVAAGRPLADGVCAHGGRLRDGSSDICDLSDIETLPGEHNWQNAAAACAVARELGVSPGDIAARLATYPGLPHRQEIVGRAGNVRYVNDSKATNPEAASRALACYDDIFWIAGGIAKEDGLGPVLDHAGRIRHAFLIGEAAAQFAHALKDRAPARTCGDLKSALTAAHRAAREFAGAATVLLSPAGASFDQFGSFAERGDAFRDLVRDLVAAEASA